MTKLKQLNMDLAKMAEDNEKTGEKDDSESPLDQFKKLFSYYLKQNHTGEENAIFSRELEELFHMGGRDIRRIVSSLRKDGIPICSGSHKGYYYAEKQSEITDTLKGLGEHIASVCSTVERLQNIRIAGKPKIRSVSIVIAREDGPDEELVLMVS